MVDIARQLRGVAKLIRGHMSADPNPELLEDGAAEIEKLREVQQNLIQIMLVDGYCPPNIQRLIDDALSVSKTP